MGFRNRNIQIFIYALLLLLPFFSLGQTAEGALKGRVTNSAHEGIPGITVLPEGYTDKGTITNHDGIFLIEGLKAGTYTLLISGVGFEAISKKVQTGSGKNEFPEFELQEKIIEMAEVEVTGESVASRLKKEGFELESIDTKSIQSQSVGLNQVLDQVPGIRVRQDGGGWGPGPAFPLMV